METAAQTATLPSNPVGSPRIAWYAAPLTIYLLVLFVFPVGALLASGFNPADYVHIFKVPVYRDTIAITFEIALLVALLSILLSYPVAYLLATVSDVTRKLLIVLVLVPFWTSALVRTTAWIILLQRNGVVNSLLLSMGLVSHPVAFVYNLSGVLIGMAHVLMPFVALPLYAAFRSVDLSLVQAAEGLGAGPVTLFRRIMMPLTAPGVLAGATIVFMSALGYYITPALMGGPRQTMISQLIAFNINVQLNWGLAAALSVVLLVVTLAVFATFQTTFGLDRLMANAGGGGTGVPFGLSSRGRTVPGRIVGAVGILVLIFLIAPIVVVFPMSLGSSPFLAFPPAHLSFRWYAAFFERPQWTTALWNSLLVAAIAVSGATALGTAAAVGISQLRPRTARLFETFFILPMIVPAIIVAVALYFLFAPWGLVSSRWGLGLGHIVLASPFVVLTVRAALKGLDPTLELAAFSLGASWLTAFRRVVFPVISPGIAAGMVFAFITSFDDVVLALFLTNVRSRTLPKLMYEGVAHEIDPTITAVAALLVLFTLGVLALNMLLSRATDRASRA